MGLVSPIGPIVFSMTACDLLSFLHEEYLGGEVVAVAVEEHARTVGTQWIAFSVTLLSLEEVSV